MDGSDMTATAETEAAETTTPPGFMVDPKGNLIAEANVKASDRLIDDTVRKVVGHADDLSAQIARFRGHTHDDIETLISLLGEQYGVTKSRSPKGDIRFTTFDGLLQVRQQSQDQMDFGPELQIAKDVLDEILPEMSEGASEDFKALAHSAFDTSSAGKINRDAILRFRRLELSHPRWPDVQAAITDSIRSYGRKSYIRVYRRENAEAAWVMIPLSLASA